MASWEIVHSDGTIKTIEVDLTASRVLYTTALKQLREAGFDVQTRAVKLVPQPKLVAIIQQSQESALAGEGGEIDGAA